MHNKRGFQHHHRFFVFKYYPSFHSLKYLSFQGIFQNLSIKIFRRECKSLTRPLDLALFYWSRFLLCKLSTTFENHLRPYLLYRYFVHDKSIIVCGDNIHLIIDIK